MTGDLKVLPSVILSGAFRDTEQAAMGGLDIEMPATMFYGPQLLQAVQDGKVAKEIVDESAFRVARTVLKFETAPDPLPEYPEKFIGSSEHIALALEAAEKSMVLMQNNQAILPLDKSQVKHVLVLGELAITENIGDHGSSQVRPAYVVTPMQGLEKPYGENVHFLMKQEQISKGQSN